MSLVNSGRVVTIGLLALAGSAVLFGHPLTNLRRAASDLDDYDFRATRKLVRLVREAAELVRREGPEAFETFRSNPERWAPGWTYVYVYHVDGTNLFHGGAPELEKRNLYDVVDPNGRRIFQLSFEATEDPDNPDGWVHYTWNPPERIYSVGKSSCHYRVTMPDGREVIVGGGLDEPPPERAFARFAVDAAARLLRNEARSALPEIDDPSSRFAFREVKVFVLDAEGSALVDPALSLREPRNLRDYQDDAGNKPFETVLQWTWDKDRAWLVVLTKSRNDRIMLKRGLYVRRIETGGEYLMVGACVSLPRPVWAK